MKGSYIIGVDNKIWNLQFKELDNKIPQHWSSKYRNLKSLSMQIRWNKMNCELMLTYDTSALWQTGSRILTGQKTLPTIWGIYIKLVTKYQISAINSC
jgi:hypothetical protein